MQVGKSLVELAQEVERQSNAQKDMIVPSGRMEMVAYDSQMPALKIQGEDELFPLTETGHDTLIKQLKIPGRYYYKMRQEAPALLGVNVNVWLKKEQDEGVSRMVRTLDGNARAVLSDAYKRRDNYEFLTTVFPVLQEECKSQGMEIDVLSTEITERRMYVQLAFAGLDAEFKVNRHEREIGEVVKAGLILRNSEIGYGCREIGFLVYTLSCKNGLIVPRSVGSFSHRHLGARRGTGEVFALSDEALEADAHAFALATRDAVRQMVNRNTLQHLVDRMKDANKRKITGNLEDAVTVLGKSYQLDQGEQKSILDHLMRGGDYTHYGLTNAITRSAQDTEDYDRAITLEEVGGTILYLNERQLDPILAAKPQPKKESPALSLMN